MKYVMALDQGTTSSRCIIFDKSGQAVSSVNKEFTQYYPHPGWVEHDAREIWDTTLEVSRAAMQKLGITASDIAAIGITNQRETTVVWDKNTGEPVSRAIVWQCRRTADIVDKLVEDGHADTIRGKTGLVPDAYFSGTKIKWIIDNVPGARDKAERGELLFGTVDTWLIWNLTGGKAHVTDYTNASRTMIFNIHTLGWDKELLGLLGIPETMLPEVKPSSYLFGKTEFSLYGGEIPISGAAGDQQCALFGQCCFDPGEMKNTYGTGCFLLLNTGDSPVESKSGLITTVAASDGEKPQYALEGSIFVAGAAVQWLRDSLNVISSAPESEQYAEKVPDSADGYVVPAFTGIGAPYWNQRARGAVVGITRGFTRAHLVRATLESMAYQTYDIARAMEKDADIPIRELKVDGGAALNGFLMQFQADIMNCKVVRPACVETTALGAAYLAGLAVEYWKNKNEIKKNMSESTVFSPQADREKCEKLIRGWHRAVRCALAWADDEL